ncbi:MAG: aldehyde dehydrogenase family protein [Gemmatimonadetes bacterium]|nr:aldehyde dehydrogenase family protein [Gemmatimonadota bacterium]
MSHFVEMNTQNVTPLTPPRRAVESRDPATGEVWRTWDPADAATVAAAVARARHAQPAWAARSPSERARIVTRFHDALYRRRREVAELVTREAGKPIVDALSTDVTVALDFAAWTARALPRFFRASWRGAAGITMWRKRVRFERRALGVIGVIAPWNYPFFLPAACTLPVIGCGNAAILKPSEFTPGSGAILEELWREAGLPEGVLQVIQGDGVTGAALTRGGVDKMIFTGGSAAGRAVALACAEQMIPCSLELGGSDAAVVLADADLRHAADGIVWTRFSNAGQTCVAPKRVFVEQPAYAAFVEAASRAVRALRVGPGAEPGSEVGPLIRPHAVSAIQAQLSDATDKGARVVAQAPLQAPPQVTPRATQVADGYFPPTLLTDVRDGMKVLDEETFGPILPVVPVRDADEAVARANASSYGLSASVWTRDRAAGLAVARRLEAGTVLLNDAITVVGMPDVPYGGVKRSGLGRLHGDAGLEECVHSMAIVDDRFATWHQPWWFGYGPRHLAHIEAYQRLAHGGGLLERLSGLGGTIRMLLTRKGTA